MVQPVSRGKIVAVISAVAVAVFIFYFWNDINLSNEVVSGNLPDVVVENLNFRRTIESKDWHITADTAEHNSGLIIANSMDININDLLINRRTTIYAQNGEFERDTSNLLLRSLDGFVFLEDRSVDLAAPLASYESSSDTWSFERGIEIEDDETFITGNEATITSDGIFSLEKGAHARWNIN